MIANTNENKNICKSHRNTHNINQNHSIDPNSHPQTIKVEMEPPHASPKNLTTTHLI